MRLCFTKEDEEIVVYLMDGDNRIDFQYSEMIMRMYVDKQVLDPIIDGDFSENERKSIVALNDEFKKLVINKKEEPGLAEVIENDSLGNNGELSTK